MIKYSLEDYLRFDIKTHTTKSGVSLLYYENLSAGGEIHSAYIIDIIQQTGRKHYNRAHEWCCGLGAIGFELLGRQVCDHITLSDKFLPAIISCNFTAAANKIQHCTETYIVNEFDNLPTTNKWDLVVADPPHFGEIPKDLNANEDGIRQVVDTNWNSHRIFFQTISKYVSDDADIYLFEGCYGSSPATFIDMIASSGLDLIDVYNYTTHKMPSPHHYIMHLKPKKLNNL